MASRFEYHVIADAVEVVSTINGEEHRIRCSGKWIFPLKGPLEPEDAILYPEPDPVIYREVVDGVMEFRVGPGIFATLVCGAQLTAAAEALKHSTGLSELRALRSSLAPLIEIPTDEVGLLAGCVWDGSWRTGPGVRTTKRGRKVDTLLTRLRNALRAARWLRNTDGRRDSLDNIDPLIATMPSSIIAPLYSGSGELIAPSLADQRSYDDAMREFSKLDVDWKAVNRDTHFSKGGRGRRGFLLRASGDGVEYRANPAAWQALYRKRGEVAEAVRKHSRRIAAPNLAQSSDGVFREHVEGGITFTHWLNRDL
jgi:hypothetical protein